MKSSFPSFQRLSSALLITCSVSVNLKAATPGVAVGGGYSLFLKSDGAVWAVGVNTTGQLGNGTITGTTTPIRTMTGLQSMYASFEGCSLFLKTNGTVWGAGRNLYGQIGDGSTVIRTEPVQSLTGVMACSMGSRHTLFLKTDGSVWATGANGMGQLGDGTTSDRATPVQVLTEVKAISAGGHFSLFIKNDDSVWATGSNFTGQFGNGTTEWIGSTTPIPVLTGVSPSHEVLTAKAISTGVDHSLFLKDDGTAWAAGYNVDGRLGDGTTILRSTPVQVMTNVKAICAGSEHSFFLGENGGVWATGNNYLGRLGDGTTSSRSTPAEVLTDAKAISTGVEHSLFIKTDNTVWAAGSNIGGQLGSGIPSSNLIPVKVFELTLDPAGDWQRVHFAANAEEPLISGWNADPDHDGVVNLLERAFNLPPLQAGRPILLPHTGTNGLPLIRAVDEPSGRGFSIHYLRRKASTNPGLTYTPQFSSTLEDGGSEGWVDATGPEIVEEIDTEWERVTVEENATGVPKRFGRVKVTSTVD